MPFHFYKTLGSTLSDVSLKPSDGILVVNHLPISHHYVFDC